MFRLITAALAVAGATLGFTATADAQMMACAQRDVMISGLSAKYGESLKGVGASRSGFVSVFANSESGTWTIVITRNDGVACMLAAGQAWSDDQATLEAFDTPKAPNPNEELL